jgi:hypothetical protein
VKEKPILFSGSMVRAILRGDKTQTRRIVKPQPSEFFAPSKCMLYEPAIEDNGAMVPGLPMFGCYDINGENEGYECKWGRPGHHLWLRETFYNDCPDKKAVEHVYYRADGDCCEQIPECQCAQAGKPKWTPSIHMPRWASRITLEISGVRVERLHNISAKDIIAEGAVERPHNVEFLGKCPVSAFDGVCYPDLKSLWAHGWESVYGKGSWAKNPFVWVIQFKRIKP